VTGRAVVVTVAAELRPGDTIFAHDAGGLAPWEILSTDGRVVGQSEI